MLNYFKSKKLSILAILAGLTYTFLILSTFYNDWDDLQMNFNEGHLNAEYNSSGHVNGYKVVQSYSFFVKPKKGFASFPDSLVNLKTNNSVKTKYTELIVLGPEDLDSPKVLNTIITTILAFLVLIATIRIPIHFYRIISLIKKNIIFEKETIRLLIWLGFELLIIYFGNVLFNYMVHQINCSLFSFSEYEIVIRPFDPIWLLLGIVVLLIAEILSKARVLKEEQELTI